MTHMAMPSTTGLESCWCILVRLSSMSNIVSSESRARLGPTHRPSRYQLNKGQFLVCLKLDSSGDLRRATDADLEKLFGLLPPLQRSERHPSSIVIHQVIVIVKVGQ